MSCNHHTNGHQPEHPCEDANHVAHKDACPKCGERHVDQLIWIEDDVVLCGTCGTEYDPTAPTTQAEGGDDAHQPG